VCPFSTKKETPLGDKPARFSIFELSFITPMFMGPPYKKVRCAQKLAGDQKI
jgi:hypothetical protein